MAIEIIAVSTCLSNALSEDTVENQDATKSLTIFLTVLWISSSSWRSSAPVEGIWGSGQNLWE